MTPEHADTLINDYVMPLPESCGRFIPAIRQAMTATRYAVCPCGCGRNVRLAKPQKRKPWWGKQKKERK